MTAPFTVVMPMKAWDRAKSRLHADPAVRRALAEAFARDTLAAVLACPDVGKVVVVTRGDLVVSYVRGAGAQVIQEPADRPYGVEAVLRDDSGNWLVLVEQKPYTADDFT